MMQMTKLGNSYLGLQASTSCQREDHPQPNRLENRKNALNVVKKIPEKALSVLTHL